MERCDWYDMCDVRTAVCLVERRLWFLSFEELLDTFCDRGIKPRAATRDITENKSGGGIQDLKQRCQFISTQGTTATL